MVDVKVGSNFKFLRCGRDWGNVLFIEDFVICEMWQYCRCVVFWSSRRFCIIEMRWGLDGRCWGSCRFYICEMWQRHMRCTLKISHLWDEAQGGLEDVASPHCWRWIPSRLGVSSSQGILPCCCEMSLLLLIIIIIPLLIHHHHHRK